ncbi:hypothetical protein ACWDWO_28975, partial [Actinopolymorpha singaporensis]
MKTNKKPPQQTNNPKKTGPPVTKGIRDKTPHNTQKPKGHQARAALANGAKNTASTFGTLLSSQGSDTHQNQTSQPGS